MAISFTIPGKPFAKKRHRIGISHGHARAFNDPDNVSFEEKVAGIARPFFTGHNSGQLTPLTGPVKINIVAVFEMPKSWSNKKRLAMNGQPHCSKPDRDNVDKAICDGLNRIAWVDDAQVADGRTVKKWGLSSFTFVKIEAIE